jgi:hypothetical protein
MEVEVVHQVARQHDQVQTPLVQFVELGDRRPVVVDDPERERRGCVRSERVGFDHEAETRFGNGQSTWTIAGAGAGAGAVGRVRAVAVGLAGVDRPDCGTHRHRCAEGGGDDGGEGRQFGARVHHATS